MHTILDVGYHNISAKLSSQHKSAKWLVFLYLNNYVFLSKWIVVVHDSREKITLFIIYLHVFIYLLQHSFCQFSQRAKVLCNRNTAFGSRSGSGSPCAATIWCPLLLPLLFSSLSCATLNVHCKCPCYTILLRRPPMSSWLIWTTRYSKNNCLLFTLHTCPKNFNFLSVIL